MQQRELKCRLFDFGEDYPEVCEWWRAHKWHYLPTHALSKVGFLVHDEKVKYCVGWLYSQDSSIGVFEWVTTNPKSPLLGRKQAIELLVTNVISAAKNMGMRTIFSSLRNENLVSLYSRCGFKVTDTQMTNLVAEVL